MFSAGEKVIYGRMGACVIREIAVRNFDGSEREYYILSPVRGRDQSIYVPTENAALTAKMKLVMSDAEISALMAEIAAGEMEWIEDDNERREAFDALLAEGCAAGLARLVGCIWRRRDWLAERSRKLHQSDERALREARERLHGELSLALDIPEEQVPAYIEGQLCILAEK